MRKQEETTRRPGRGPIARSAARSVSAVGATAPITAPPARPGGDQQAGVVERIADQLGRGSGLIAQPAGKALGQLRQGRIGRRVQHLPRHLHPGLGGRQRHPLRRPHQQRPADPLPRRHRRRPHHPRVLPLREHDRSPRPDRPRPSADERTGRTEPPRRLHARRHRRHFSRALAARHYPAPPAAWGRRVR